MENSFVEKMHSLFYENLGNTEADIQQYRLDIELKIKQLYAAFCYLRDDDIKSMVDALKTPVEQIKYDSLLHKINLDETELDVKKIILMAMVDALGSLADAARFQKRALEAEEGLKNINDRISKAWAEYNSPDCEIFTTRAKAFFDSMGFTILGRKEKTDKDILFRSYRNLVFGKDGGKPIGKWEAIEILTRVFDLSSTDACLEQLRRHVRKSKKYLKEMGLSLKGYDNILPGRDEYKKN